MLYRQGYGREIYLLLQMDFILWEEFQFRTHMISFDVLMYKDNQIYRSLKI